MTAALEDSLLPNHSVGDKSLPGEEATTLDAPAGSTHAPHDAAAPTAPGASPQSPAPGPSEKPKQDPKQARMTREDWKKLPLQFAKVWLIVFVMWMGLLSFYWGALYHREHRVKNMPMLVVVEDASFQLSNLTTVQPIIGPQFERLLGENEGLGKFVFANAREVHAEAEKHNQTVMQHIQQKVHHQRYWAAMHVQRNASATVYEMLRSGSVQSAAGNQLQNIITVVYESGRHFSALSQYVSKNIKHMQLAWTASHAPQAYAQMAGTLLDAQQTRRIQRANSTQGSVLSYVPPFRLVDYRPGTLPVVLGPSELGLIYAQIFSFHQFNFSADLHNSVRAKLRFRHFVYYRILFSQVNHVMLALVYALITKAFQVSTEVAFGRAGFMVLWVTMYLFIGASGGLNECAGTLIAFHDKKVLLPPWIIFNVVVNISPTFAPFDLLPGFYRYGYAVPMYNAYEALKVVFFDTWKGTLGRNYAILGAWVVASNVALAGILVHVSRSTHRREDRGR